MTTTQNDSWLETLSRGTSFWNEWRKLHPLEIPLLTKLDFSGWDLIGCNFGGVDLSWSKFDSARLDYANFSRANLTKCSFRKTSLINADLSSTKLHKVDLHHADLTNASLENAIFERASIENARFRGTNFRNARLSFWSASEADFCDANFAGASISDEGESLVNLVVGPIAPYFLEFATALNLDRVALEGEAFVVDYLSRAFVYAHSEAIPERQNKELLHRISEKIRSFLSIYSTPQEVPPHLIQCADTINAEIIRYIQKNPQKLYEIAPRQFEELVAELLASFGWQVELTPATKDGGFDIFGISKDISGVKTSWLIECKRYKAENKVGVEIVRSLYALKNDLRVANAMLATTSGFTKGVHDFKASRYDFELREYGSILEWINSYKPHPDGKLFIRENRIAHVPQILYSK